MGRLLLIAMALLAAGAWVIEPRKPRARAVAAVAPLRVEAVASPVAYRPGEPMLVPGQAIDLHRAADGHFYADAMVNGQSVAVMVDTGASVVALTIDDAQRLGLSIDPATFAIVGSGASGPVRGVAVTLDSVALGGRHEGAVRAVVVEGLDRSLLGQSFLSRLDQVQITGDTMTMR